MAYGIPVYRTYTGVRKHVGFFSVNQFPADRLIIPIAPRFTFNDPRSVKEMDNPDLSMQRRDLKLDWFDLCVRIDELLLMQSRLSINDHIAMAIEAMLRDEFRQIPDNIDIVPPDGWIIEKSYMMNATIVKLRLPSIIVHDFESEEELFDMEAFYPAYTEQDVEYFMNKNGGNFGRI